jgi:hypothetical protein
MSDEDEFYALAEPESEGNPDDLAGEEVDDPTIAEEDKG